MGSSIRPRGALTFIAPKIDPTRPAQLGEVLGDFQTRYIAKPSGVHGDTDIQALETGKQVSASEQSIDFPPKHEAVPDRLSITAEYGDGLQIWEAQGEV